MTKAEQRAWEAYPYSPTEVNLFGHKTITADGNSCDRAKYLNGYEQAEKDLVNDLKRILSISKEGWLESNVKTFIKELEEKK